MASDSFVLIGPSQFLRKKTCHWVVKIFNRGGNKNTGNLGRRFLAALPLIFVGFTVSYADVQLLKPPSYAG